MPQLAELTRPEDFSEVALAALPRSLDELRLLVRRDLDLTRYAAKSWVLPRRAPDGARALDVLIVGAGQAGLACAFGLLQQRVTNIQVIDENRSGQEGPWATYARMPTLRTQKDVGGIDLGLPSLSFRAWFEVQHGRKAWGALYKIPTELWHAYLQWYRETLEIPVANSCRLVRFGPGPDGLIESEVENGTERRTLWARTLVLATGIEGNGARNVPAFIMDNVPRTRWAHTHEDIDFAALARSCVAVLGGAASAFDNAIAAAEHDAKVHLFHREKQVTAATPLAWAEFNGYLAHFPDLAPHDRWRFTRQLQRFKTGPPMVTAARARALPNLRIHAGASWKSVALENDKIRIDATDGALSADFLILGTGYVTDVTRHALFAEHLPVLALWCDVYMPPAGDEDAALSNSTYLGANFEMQEKTAGTAPWLSTAFNFSRGAQMSMGAMPIGLSGIKFGVPRLVQGVTKQLFTSDAEKFFEGMKVWQASDNVAEP